MDNLNLSKELIEISKGLNCVSETDASFQFFELAGKSLQPLDEIRRAFPDLTEGQTDSQSIDMFFEPMISGEDNPEAFQRLSELFNKRLSDSTVVRFGRVEKNTFLLGRDVDGKWIGLRTFQVET